MSRLRLLIPPPIICSALTLGRRLKGLEPDKVTLLRLSRTNVGTVKFDRLEIGVS